MMKDFPYRIGSGHDSHRLEEGRPLILCGVKIDHPFGLVGHSDADVVMHAVVDDMVVHDAAGADGGLGAGGGRHAEQERRNRG